MTRRLLLLTMLFIGGLLAACQSGLAPTQVYIVVTATPEADAATSASADTTQVAQASTPQTGPVPLEDDTATPRGVGTQPTARPSSTSQPTATANATVSSTPTPDMFPTPVEGQIYVAEQVFQDGRMFWIRPTNQIWVLTTNDEGEQVWDVYEDTFREGMPETDPSIDPPEDFVQPERGFGMLWRQTPRLRDQLGWALEREVGYFTDYEYHAGGTVQNGTYEPGFGYHLVENIARDVYRFNEANRTWEIVESADE